MAIIKSAKKAIRSSKRKLVFNLARKTAIKDIQKKIEKLLKDKKVSEAKVLIPLAYQAIDKAVKTNLLKKNNGARKKSRLMARINKIQN